MKRYCFRLVRLFLAAGLALGSSACRPTEPAAPPRDPPAEALPVVRETAVRNVTSETVSYTLRHVSGMPDGPAAFTVAPGEIARHRSAAPLEIEFSNGLRPLTYTLELGKPYCFRLDENDRLDVFLGSHDRADAVDLAPYVPTPAVVVDTMLEMAEVKSGDVLYDIGSGDGRIVIAAARKAGARGVGIDLDQELVDASIAAAADAGVSRLVRFLRMDATKADLSEATVVTMYLLPESNALLRRQLQRQLRPGTRVVTHNYRIAGWESREKRHEALRDEAGENHDIFLYVR